MRTSLKHTWGFQKNCMIAARQYYLCMRIVGQVPRRRICSRLQKQPVHLGLSLSCSTSSLMVLGKKSKQIE